MAESAFVIGARVRCSDGPCGRLTRVVVNPVDLSVTHLVVEHWHEHLSARLVPVGLAEGTADAIVLRCTRAEFEDLDPAEERNFVTGPDHPAYRPGELFYQPYFSLGEVAAAAGIQGAGTPGQVWTAGGGHEARRTYTYDSVPLGEVQVRRGDHVHATDGEIGIVEGLVIDPGNHKVTHVLLQEGHLWGRKDVAIPIGAVASAQAGIRLSLSRQQVMELPPVDIDRPGG